MSKPLLVVDDEALNRDMLSRRLSRAGFEVEVAASGPEAWRMIREREVEMVLLDNMMPGMSGVELLKLLRGVYAPEELPVIMVTAVSESPRIVEALTLGANDYVTKPIDFAVTLARIRAQLEQKRARQRLRESEERYALAAKGSNDGLWDWDLGSGRMFYSPRWKEMLGYLEPEIGVSAEEWLGRVHPDDVHRLSSELGLLRSNGAGCEFRSEHRVLHRDGSYRWMLARATVLRDGSGRATRMAGSMSDITSAKETDPLTGLPNRLRFEDALEQALERSKQNPARSFAVLFLDLDRFKVVNDSLGHQAGDQLLVGVAARIRNSIRGPDTDGTRNGESGDLIARLGGDEFAILLDPISNVGDATAVAARIGKAVSSRFSLEGRAVVTTASIGIALCDGTYEAPNDILRDADTAMYRAKSLGKARYEVFGADMRASVLRRMELETGLQQALGQRELTLYYQPKLDLVDERLIGFEALLRWHNPRLGAVPPAQFIGLAEETGLIVPIGYWVLREACKTTNRWRLECADGGRAPEISVNLSPRQFWQPDLLERINEILAETGLPPEFLHLEITESVVIHDFEHAALLLESLREVGVGIKIDDFGTGYSSLNYLVRLPCTALKIDRSFVTRVCEDPACSTVIETIVGMAHNLGLQAIAEGIETKEQFARLRELGCECGQGYYFSRPVPEAEADKLVIRGFPRS